MANDSVIKMEVPLKIQIANLIKAKTEFLVSDNDFRESYLEYDDQGRVVYDRWVWNDRDLLYVAKGVMGVRSGRWSLTKFRPASPQIERIMVISVKDNQFTELRVTDPEYEAESEIISGLIMNELGIRPKVSLMRG